MASILKVDTIQAPNGTTAATIDTSGRIAKPNTPYFYAHRSSALNYQTSLTTVVYNSVHENIGSHYDSSTGVFTAPIDGIYLFSCAANVGAGLTQSRYFNIELFHNNTLGVFVNRNNAADDTGSSADYAGIELTGILKMDANDTMRVRVEIENSQASYISDRSNFFTGILLA